MNYEHIRVELNEAGQCISIVLDRAPTNLLNIQMMEELNDALKLLKEHPWAEVLILRGARGVFSEGFDLNEHVKSRVQRLLQVYLRFFETIRILDVIAIAAVEGRAWGAGFELALGCNMIVAADDASFALPQVAQGSIPPVAAAILPRIAPRRKAMEWIITGNDISAQRLEHDGVVNRLFPAAEMDARLGEFVAEITSKSNPVMQIARRAQFEGYYRTFPDALHTIQQMYVRELMELSDAAEGNDAALARRTPDWKNR
jgi:enoyl-CoA hydratase/carnithine racemase